jgi:hypothetical protein
LDPYYFYGISYDLPECVKSQVRLFADDCLLYRQIKNREDHILLQNDLTCLEEWAHKWGMRFNVKKRYVMSIKGKSSCLYNLDKTVLQQVTENPYLGILLSEVLGWSKHIAKTASKASSTLGFGRRNLKNCPISSRKTAYMALVLSVLEYGSIVWDPYLTRDIVKLERIQRNGARFITGDYKSRHEGAATNMLKYLDLPTLQDRRTNAKLVFLYKVFEGLVPAIDHDTLIKPNRPKRQIRSVIFADCVAQNIIDRPVTNNTRSFAVPVSKTNQYRNSFFVDIIVNWKNYRKTQHAQR